MTKKSLQKSSSAKLYLMRTKDNAKEIDDELDRRNFAQSKKLKQQKITKYKMADYVYENTSWCWDD